MNVEEELFIGQIVYKTETGLRASLQPLFYFDREMRQWVECRHHSELFPNQGKVHWYLGDNSSFKIRQYDYWVFEVEESRTYEPETFHSDQFQVKPQIVPEPLLKIIDLKEFGDENCIREKLTSEWTSLLNGPNSEEQIILQVGEKTWLGPLSLLKNPESNTWRLNKYEQHYITPGPGAKIRIDSASMAIRSCWNKDAACFWHPDNVVLNHYFNILKRYERNPAGLILSKKVKKQLVEEIISFNAIHADHPKVIGFGNRALEIFQRIEKETTLYQYVMDQLIDRPTVRQELDQRVETEYQTHLEERKKDLSAATAREQKQLEKISGKITTQKKELGRLAKEIEKRQREQALLASHFGDALEAKFQELSKKPESWLVESSLMRAYLNLTRTKDQIHTDFYRSKHDADPPAPVSEKTETCTFQESAQKLQVAFLQAGYSGNLARQVLASFLTGLVPTFGNDDAYELLAAFARIFTGGRLHWVPISPTSIAPEDLFDRRAPPSEGTAFSRGSLRELFASLQDDHRPRLLVLDGINRACVENYLLPILGCYQDSWHDRKPGRGLPLPLNPGQKVSWPTNLMLATTLIRGATILPLPCEYWPYATFFPIGFFHDHTMTDINSESGPLSELSKDDWRKWFKKASSEFKPEQTEGLPLPQLNLGASYLQALEDLGLNENEAKKAWRHDFLTPRIISKKDVFERQESLDRPFISACRAYTHLEDMEDYDV